MAKENTAQLAVAAARQAVTTGRNMGVHESLALADVEVRSERAKQHELQNMIAMAANPLACPFPRADVLARIKELTNLG